MYISYTCHSQSKWTWDHMVTMDFVLWFWPSLRACLSAPFTVWAASQTMELAEKWEAYQPGQSNYPEVIGYTSRMSWCLPEQLKWLVKCSLKLQIRKKETSAHVKGPASTVQNVFCNTHTSDNVLGTRQPQSPCRSPNSVREMGKGQAKRHLQTSPSFG